MTFLSGYPGTLLDRFDVCALCSQLGGPSLPDELIWQAMADTSPGWGLGISLCILVSVSFNNTPVFARCRCRKGLEE